MAGVKHHLVHVDARRGGDLDQHPAVVVTLVAAMAIDRAREWATTASDDLSARLPA